MGSIMIKKVCDVNNLYYDFINIFSCYTAHYSTHIEY